MRLLKGQGLVEYALIIVLVAIVVIAILLLLGPSIGDIFTSIVEVLNPVSHGGTGAEGDPGGGEGETPPECYGTLLLPIMMTVTGMVFLIMRFLPLPVLSDDEVQSSGLV
jgi:pilus assembly protein Flp/PilA